MTVVSLSELTSSVSNLQNTKTVDSVLKVKDLRTSFSTYLNQSAKDVPLKKDEPVVQKEKENKSDLLTLKKKDSLAVLPVALTEHLEAMDYSVTH